MSREKKFGIVCMLFLLYFEILWNYSNSANELFRDSCFAFAFRNLCICSAILMISPFVWRLVNERKFEYQIGKKICAWNSIIAFIISVIFLNDNQITFIGGVGAVMYYFINKWLFVDEKENFYEEETNTINENDDYLLQFKMNGKIDNYPLENTDFNKTLKTSNEKEINELKELYNKGILSVQFGQYDTAVRDLKEYIKKVETLNKKACAKWYTFNNCVELVMYVKENKDNVVDFVDVGYEISNAYFYLAAVDFEKKNYDEAIKNINNSLKWNPNNVNSLFEKAENFKAKGDMKTYYLTTLEIYNKVYTLKDLARFYRNLGYYFIENEEWNLAKVLYLYSVRFDNNIVAFNELKYILMKSKDSSLPDKEKLVDILKENRIPIYFSKDVIKCVKELVQSFSKENSKTNVFLDKLNNDIMENLP